MSKRLAIVGCGHLGSLVGEAVKKGLLPGYEVVAVMGRHREEAAALAGKLGCAGCEEIRVLMGYQPDFVVEAASPAACRSIAAEVLRGGADLIPLSIGAFAGEEYRREIGAVATESGHKIRFPSGAIGGFDVLRTAALMGGAAAKMSTEKGPDSLKNTPLYRDELAGLGQEVFSGTPDEAIKLLPTKVNVAIAASLATVGPEELRFSVTSTPGYVGDDHRIEIENEQVKAVVDVYSKTSDIAGWSVVALLRNLDGPFVF